MNIIGIDPGKNGGIIEITSDKINYFFIPKIGNEIDVRELNNIISNFIKDSIVFIERVHALFGASAGATWDFGYTCGLLEGIVAANNLSYNFVQPKVWQKEMFEGVTPIYKEGKKKKINDTKKMAEIAYKRLYSGLDLYITENGNKSKKVADGIVDALLIAEYGRRKYIKN